MNLTPLLRQRLFFTYVLVVSLLIGGTIWAFHAWGTKKSTPIYETAIATKGVFIQAVSATGAVSTSNTMNVTTQAGGVIKKLYVKNGDSVRRGQLLAELAVDLTTQQKYATALASYQSAKNNVESAKTNVYSLQSKLFAANQKFINDAIARNLVTSDPTYIQEQADWLAAEATYINQQHIITQAQTSLGAAGLSLQQLSAYLYAPISGTVQGWALPVGGVLTSQSATTTSSTTNNSQTVATIYTNGPITIRVNLTEMDITKVRIGNQATITFDAYPEKTFTGKVWAIDTTGSTSSNVTSYPITIALDQTEMSLYPNMTANAQIITQAKNDVLLIPTSAIITTGDETRVQVLKDGQATTVTVTVGEANDTQTEITSGLAEGEVVITGTDMGSDPSNVDNSSSPFSTNNQSNRSNRSGANRTIFQMGGGPPPGGF